MNVSNTRDPLAKSSETGASRSSIVTFAIFAYNHEKFIEDAIMGALSQSYQPLEIIISDDQSTDGTFEIMRRVVAGYAGPHRVVLRQNDRNLGVGSHVNAVVAASTGDLIVGAAGDDVSKPERVRILHAAWQQQGCPGSICSMASVIDAQGSVVAGRYTGYDGQFPEAGEPPVASLIRYAQDGSRNLLGCTAGWNRAVFDTFGPISSDVINEDNVIGFRSWLLSHVGYIDDVLVGYRTHGTNLYHSNTLKILTSYQDFLDAEMVRIKRARWESAYLKQHLLDIGRARELQMRDAGTLDSVEALLGDHWARKQVIVEWTDSGMLARAMKILGLGKRADYRFKLSQLIRLSTPAYCSARYLLRTLAQWRRDALARFGNDNHGRDEA